MKPFFTLENLSDETLDALYKHGTLGVAIKETVKRCADIANAKLQRESKKVVCRLTDGKWQCDEHPGFARVTHVALLINVEEIEK